MKGVFYRFIMRLSHKYNWHYAPPVYPDGDTKLKCNWCGFSQVVERVNYTGGIIGTADNAA